MKKVRGIKKSKNRNLLKQRYRRKKKRGLIKERDVLKQILLYMRRLVRGGQ